jgi:signal transduction histidine kinase
VLIGACTLLAALIPIFRFSVEQATLRAAIETLLIGSGLVSVWFIWIRSTRTRQVSDFLLLAALATLTLVQFVFCAGPVMLGSHSSDYEAAVPLIAHLQVGLMFAAAALTPPYLTATRRQATVLLATPVVAVAAVAVGGLVLGGDAAWFGSDHDGSTTAGQVVALTVPGVGLMLVAAVGFVRSVFRQWDFMMGLLGGAAILLAAAWSLSPSGFGLVANPVSGRESLFLGAFGLILLFAFHSHAQLQRRQADEATAMERRRFACDLHDGIAQDLAFIATYSEHLVQDFGPEHPLTVAARRALAASRGVIADLSASDAPNATAALRAVADELSVRHGACVTVEADGQDVTPRAREAVVRIAREAIVNAVQHGHAQHIAVELKTRGDECRLRISDDGCGLRNGVSADAHRGIGLRAIRDRAEAVGGDLVVRDRSEGGAAVEAVVSQRCPEASRR